LLAFVEVFWVFDDLGVNFRLSLGIFCLWDALESAIKKSLALAGCQLCSLLFVESVH
jgi:hypothetical protein